ncbi:MAG: CoA transferase subunit A [Geminicoccaceae bacterium]
MSIHLLSVEDIAAAVPAGALLGVPADYSGVPMAVTRALIRRRARSLRLFCLPSTSIQGDMLVGAGCVASIETAAVTLGEYGLAPRFCHAVEAGSIEISDSTCPALHAQLQATEKGVPFLPLRGLIGTDIFRHRPDWKLSSNPFGKGEDRIVLLPATRLDVTVFHAAKADREGNIWIGRRRELATLAHASAQVFVTVEQVTDDSFFDSEAGAAGTLPAFYVDGIAVAEKGAWPCGIAGLYEPDGEALRTYAEAARTDEDFRAYLVDQGIVVPEPA